MERPRRASAAKKAKQPRCDECAILPPLARKLCVLLLGAHCYPFLRSATYFVGYVEDEETPEMIMRKFETLERLQANVASGSAPTAEDEGAEGSGAAAENAAGAAGAEEQGMTEEQLLEVFKQTSQFTVKAALEGNDVLLGALR